MPMGRKAGEPGGDYHSFVLRVAGGGEQRLSIRVHDVNAGAARHFSSAASAFAHVAAAIDRFLLRPLT